MWCVFAEIVCAARGSQMTMSASLPTAIVPFFGNIPMSFAGVVDVTSTQRLSVMRPCTTPPSYVRYMRVSTPGAPFGDFSKIPNGAPGVETRMYLTYDGGVVQGRITLSRWVEVTSTTPAKLMGMFPKKGTIAVGSDADIVIWDPRASHTISAKTHHMRVDYNPYEGRKVKGKPMVVMSRGEVIVEKDKFLGRKGRGRFIKRGSPILQT